MMMEVSRPPEYASTIFSGMSISPSPGRGLRFFAGDETANAVAEQHEQNGFLRVQTVFRLVENDRNRGFQHGPGHFIAAMRRQAMHEQRAGLGARHEAVVHLEGSEYLAARFAFLFLAHTGPHVGVYGIGSGDSGFGI